LVRGRDVLIVKSGSAGAAGSRSAITGDGNYEATDNRMKGLQDEGEERDGRFEMPQFGGLEFLPHFHLCF
jgi:hypothetical protein